MGSLAMSLGSHRDSTPRGWSKTRRCRKRGCVWIAPLSAESSKLPKSRFGESTQVDFSSSHHSDAQAEARWSCTGKVQRMLLERVKDVPGSETVGAILPPMERKRQIGKGKGLLEKTRKVGQSLH